MEQVQSYPLDPEKVYMSADELTLTTDAGEITRKMGEWVALEPVMIHRMIVREKVLKVDEFELLRPLESKLRKADPDYYKRFVGLKLVIDYPGYSNGIVARIPYENDPVGFYKWWRKGAHEDKVFLSLAWQIKLFQKVALMDPKMLLKKDYDILRS
ncbi:MAG: hypothetical protein J5632_03185 [Bacteroidales bacterium]|nr:hypothetical protein [Bacteroidales bacterium]